MEKDLIGLGIEVVTEPLLEIRPLVWDTAVLNCADALIVTSANAVPSLPQDCRRGLPVFAVGPDTADALYGAGFYDVRSAGGTAEDLMRMVKAAWKPEDGALLYLSGQEVSQEMAAQLCLQGYDAKRVPVYAAEPALSLSPATTSILRQGRLSGVILMSVRTATTFRRLVAAYKLEVACRGMIAFCLSAKIGDALKPLRWADIAIASVPTRAGLLQAVKSTQALLGERK